jgi:hypothetical protein
VATNTTGSPNANRPRLSRTHATDSIPNIGSSPESA